MEIHERSFSTQVQQCRSSLWNHTRYQSLDSDTFRRIELQALHLPEVQEVAIFGLVVTLGGCIGPTDFPIRDRNKQLNDWEVLVIALWN